MIYSTARLSVMSSGDGQGFETLESAEFENDDAEDSRMEAGLYTHKILYMGPRVPKLVRTLTPKDALMLDEKSWDCYPYSKTVYASNYFGKRFTMTVESMVVEDDRGEHPNALNLPDDVLKIREVDYIDIVQDELPSGSVLDKGQTHPSTFQSKLTGRGPLKPEFEKTCEPTICIYKVVTVNLDFGPFQKKCESLAQSAGMRDLLLPFHQQVFCWIDDWFPMTIEEVRAYEKECFDKLNKAQFPHQKGKPHELKQGEEVARVKQEDYLDSPSASPMPGKK